MNIILQAFFPLVTSLPLSYLNRLRLLAEDFKVHLFTSCGEMATVLHDDYSSILRYGLQICIPHPDFKNVHIVTSEVKQMKQTNEMEDRWYCKR